MPRSRAEPIAPTREGICRPPTWPTRDGRHADFDKAEELTEQPPRPGGVTGPVLPVEPWRLRASDDWRDRSASDAIPGTGRCRLTFGLLVLLIVNDLRALAFVYSAEVGEPMGTR